MIATTKKLALGRIPYLNMLPYHCGKPNEWKYIQASPRHLGQLARAGRVDAAAFSLCDSWDITKHYEPLGNFGLSVTGAVQSVLLLSDRPLEGLSQGAIGVSEETATSVQLLETILKNLHAFTDVPFHPLQADNNAQLLIGDNALLARNQPPFDYVFDLGELWWNWQKRPFVFARWMVKKSLPDSLKADMAENLRRSLARYKTSPIDSLREGKTSPLPIDDAVSYLARFRYELTPDDLSAADLFKRLRRGQ